MMNGRKKKLLLLINQIFYTKFRFRVKIRAKQRLRVQRAFVKRSSISRSKNKTLPAEIQQEICSQLRC